MPYNIPFRVIAVSTNTNEFGLRNHILLSRSGFGVSLCLNQQNSLKEGDTVAIPIADSDLQTPEAAAYAVSRKLNGEIARPISKAPDKVVNEAWGTSSPYAQVTEPSEDKWKYTRTCAKVSEDSSVQRLSCRSVRELLSERDALLSMVHTLRDVLASIVPMVEGGAGPMLLEDFVGQANEVIHKAIQAQ